MDADRIHRAISSDGTQIAGRVHGQGPPLMLVPGGPADGETGWEALLPCLTERFTCFAINTRGRALSGDHPDHSRERLVEAHGGWTAAAQWRNCRCDGTQSDPVGLGSGRASKSASGS